MAREGCVLLEAAPAVICAYSAYYDSPKSLYPACNQLVVIPLDGISDEFNGAMVHIWPSCSRARIPIARLDEPEIPPKRNEEKKCD